jgi:hypothetical protein
MTNPMATSTDAELRDFIGFAQSLGMRVVLSLMLDPDWTLPSQFGCRVTNGQSDWCYWRGQIGWFWSKEPLECKNASDWGLWHSNYRYARLCCLCYISWCTTVVRARSLFPLLVVLSCQCFYSALCGARGGGTCGHVSDCTRAYAPHSAVCKQLGAAAGSRASCVLRPGVRCDAAGHFQRARDGSCVVEATRLGMRARACFPRARSIVRGAVGGPRLLFGAHCYHEWAAPVAGRAI